MKVGDIITVRRLESGLYELTHSTSDESSVGGAASTLIELTYKVLKDEATEEGGREYALFKRDVQ